MRSKFLLYLSLHCFISLSQDFKNITSENGLPSSQIYDIIEAKNGKLYISTFNQGLVCFDGNSYKLYNDSSFSSLYCRAVTQIKSGEILSGNSGGVGIVNNGIYAPFNLKHKGNDLEVGAICQSKDSSLFIGTSLGFIHLKNREALYNNINSNNKFFVKNIIEINNLIYISTISDLWCYNPKNKSIYNVVSFLNSINSISAYKDTLLVSTKSIGLVYFYDNKIIRATNSKTNPLLSDNVYYSYYSETKNNRYLATEKGFFKIDNKNNVTKLPLLSNIDNLLVTKIIETKNEELLIATKQHGLFISCIHNFANYKPTISNISESYPVDDSIVLVSNGVCLKKFELKSRRLTDVLDLNATVYKKYFIEKFIYDNSRNATWIALSNGNILNFNLKTKVLKMVCDNANYVNNMFIDSKNRLWIAKKDWVGLYQNDKIFVFSKFPSSKFLIQILENYKKDILVVCGNGLIKYNPIKNTFEGPLFNKRIFSSQVVEDYNKNIWMIANQGLFAYNQLKDTLIEIPFNSKYQIFESINVYDKYLITTSEKGIYLADLKTYYKSGKLNFSFYSKESGLIENIISKNNYILKPGILLTFSKNYLSTFSFASTNLKQNSNISLNLNSILLFHENFNYSKYSSSFINELPNNLLLPYFKNNLTFNFSAVSLTNKEDCIYSYKLKGFDEKYTETTINEVNYANLSAGNYTLNVKVKNSKGEWSKNEINYSFKIKTAFYKTAWFISTIILLFFLLIIIIVKRREQVIRYKNQLLEKTVQIRTTQLYNKNIEIQDKNRALETANNSLAYKNKLITDSLEYANKVQTSILKINGNFKLMLEPIGSVGIFNKPKDVVSGDFYSIFKVENNYIIISADCTGHGVPGALMTIYAYNLLSEIINNKNIVSPSTILNELNQLLFNSNQSENESYQSLAITVMSYTLNDSFVKISASDQAIFASNTQNDIIEFKFSESSPMNFNPSIANYEEKIFSLNEFNSFFLFSDGIIDQKGGELNRKLMKIGLKTIISDFLNNKLSMDSFNNFIENEYIKWTINQPTQIDDILLLAIQFKTFRNFSIHN